MKRLDYFIGFIAICAFFLLLAEISSCFGRYVYLIKFINLGILSLFMFDVILRFMVSRDKKEHIRHHWLDLIVFIPLIQFIRGIERSPFFVIVWQIVIVVMLVSRMKKANKFIALLSLRPAQLMITSFAFTIGAGTVLLMLPAASCTGVRTPFLDALFTATSAVCVTGLIVRDTSTHFSIFGQSVILGLIQVGGLGIMTFSVSLALLLKKRLEMQRQAIMQEVLDQDTLTNTRELVLFILKMTLAFEFAGALALFFIWKDRFPGPIETGYHAVFHSVSAFCNAGFSTFSDSLAHFSGDMATNIAVCLLIISGGLGFTVIRDIYSVVKSTFSARPQRPASLRVQTKIVLTASVILIAAGAAGFFFFEKNALFSGMGAREKVLCSLFQSVTSRTAGFNSCDIAGLSAASLFLTMVLMFIGGSPGSTAGGVKTTTVAVLWAVVAGGLRQRQNTEFYKRTIPQEIISKAFITFMISLCVAGGFSLCLLYFEKKALSGIIFETVSAFGTVGLSTGITPALSATGKALITALMFIGRLGPLTIGYAFMRYRRPVRYQYAEERIMIG